MKNKYESLELGQFIPLHYHHNMLNDTARMQGFKEAIDLLVKPGTKVLELGGGTGVQSFFAAQKAQKVYCVERNPELINAARNLLAQNQNGGKVELIQADAMHYLPPEPVDVVICEMLHTGLLREKQMPVIDSFKQRYLKKFGEPLPVFVPEASIQAIQPLEHDFHFSGFYAPTIQFQNPYVIQERSKGLGDPEVFQMLAYAEPYSQTCQWDGEILITEDGQLNALRLITKNLLAINVTTCSTIDWHTQYIVFPLPESMQVSKGDQIAIRFSYQGGAPLNALTDSLQVRLISKQTPVLELALEALNQSAESQPEVVENAGVR
ncbi:methyltransferase domain-containing protein [Nitrosomonas sp.]|uniref:methyltransferase domain-containing protein n=1 Tax=Nitrosomonas sp. TaxID=42353 RepID=UPI001D4904A4|nr:methyltransferase domain-containing protein [Nitrosomonas sp.]MBX3617068.1 methyltransferase domain-containing protein [Nitrosomonas sp.]